MFCSKPLPTPPSRILRISLFNSAMSTRRCSLQWRSPSQIIARPGGRRLKQQHPYSDGLHPQVSERGCPISIRLLACLFDDPQPENSRKLRNVPGRSQNKAPTGRIDSTASQLQREIEVRQKHCRLHRHSVAFFESWPRALLGQPLPTRQRGTC